MRNVLIAFAFMMTLFQVPQSFAAKVHGVFRVVKGKVKIKSGKNGKTKRAKLGAKVYPRDTIITEKNSRAKIIMSDKNIINVSPESQIVFQKYEFDPKKKKKNVLINVLYGKVRSKVNQKYNGKTSKFQVKTPSAVAGVRGTDFLASFNKSNNASQVVTFEGRVTFGLPGANGSIQNPVSIGVGQFAKSIAGQIPTPPKVIPPQKLAAMDNSSNADRAAVNDKREPSSKEGKRDIKKKKQDGNKDPGAGNDERDPASLDPMGPDDSGGGGLSELFDPNEELDPDKHKRRVADNNENREPVDLPEPPEIIDPRFPEIPEHHCNFCTETIGANNTRIIIQIENGTN